MMHTHTSTVRANNPCLHIWSFAIGERDDIASSNECPCNSGSSYSYEPSFVGNNYYFKSGTNGALTVLFSDDPLWDGMNCN